MTSAMYHLAGAGSPAAAGLALSWLVLRARLDAARDEDGMTTETVIITAGLAALAVAIVAVISTRVRDRANQIP